MMIAEGKFSPTPEQEGFFELVRGGNFPWYSLRTLDDDHSPNQFCHALMRRSLSGEPEEGIINSNYYEYSKNLFLDVCESLGLEVRDIYRLAFNNTTYSPQKWVDPHKDHEFDHKVMLLYVSQFDKGQTYLMDENKNVVHVIEPEKYKAVVFNNCYHTHTFCLPDQLRIVMVATFN